MSRIPWALVALPIAAFSCGDESAEVEVTPCASAPDVAVDAHATVSAPDGSVVVLGTTRFAPLVGGGDVSGSTAVSSERAVHDVYVGATRVTQTEWNFRAWNVQITRASLCAYASDSGTQAELPVRIYLAGATGVCVKDVPAPDGVHVPLSEDACAPPSGSGGGGGSGGGAGVGGGSGGSGGSGGAAGAGGS